jgi:hypothetical protein
MAQKASNLESNTIQIPGTFAYKSTGKWQNSKEVTYSWDPKTEHLKSGQIDFRITNGLTVQHRKFNSGFE